MITVLIGTMLLTKFKEAASESGNTTLNATYFERGESAMGAFNIGSIMIFVMGVIGSIILALYLDVHPVFIVVSIILLIVIVAIPMPILSNLYRAIIGQDALAETAERFTMAQIIIDRMPLFIALGGGIVIVTLFTRLRGEERGA
jgi:hypothetical protein